MTPQATRAELRSIALADPPGRWEALGFAVRDGAMSLGGITVGLGARGEGIVGWFVAGVDEEIDGLCVLSAPPDRDDRAEHPNGALAIDHLVVLASDFDDVRRELDRVGMALRRVVERPDGARMGFRRLGPAILELVERRDVAPGPPRFWGLVIIVADLDGLAVRLGDHLGPIRRAVQPGRRIATLRASAGLGEAVAFMDPG